MKRTAHKLSIFLVFMSLLPMTTFGQVWPEASAYKWESPSLPGHAAFVKRVFQEEWLFNNSDSLDIICGSDILSAISDVDTIIKVINKSYGGQVVASHAYDDWLEDVLWVVPQGSNSHVKIDYSYAELPAVRVAHSDSMGVNYRTAYGRGLDFVHPAPCNCQSGASPRVAAKLLTIKRKIAENRSIDIDSVGWHEVLYRARMTATQTSKSHNVNNSFYRTLYTNKLYNEFNGFGMVDINSAVAFSDTIPDDPIVANDGAQREYFGTTSTFESDQIAIFPRLDNLTGNETFATHNRLNGNVEITIQDISQYIGKGIITELPENNIFIDARGNYINIDSLTAFIANGVNLLTLPTKNMTVSGLEDENVTVNANNNNLTLENLGQVKMEVDTNNAGAGYMYLSSFSGIPSRFGHDVLGVRPRSEIQFRAGEYTLISQQGTIKDSEILSTARKTFFADVTTTSTINPVHNSEQTIDAGSAAGAITVTIDFNAVQTGHWFDLYIKGADTNAVTIEPDTGNGDLLYEGDAAVTTKTFSGAYHSLKVRWDGTDLRIDER